MTQGVVGFHGSWALALTAALGLAAACGGDDDDTTGSPPKGGSSGKAGSSSAGKGGTSSAGKGGSAGTGGAGGTSGTGGSNAGRGGTAGTGGTETGGEAGSPATGGTSGRGGSSGRGGTGGTMIIPMGGAAGESGNGGEGNTVQGGNGGEPPATGGTGGTTGQSGQGGEAGLGGQGGAPSVGPNLFFNEYVEASGTNPDALEIINKEGASVDLTGCAIHVYAAGSATATLTIALSGTLANNDVLVACTAAIGSACDVTNSGLDLSGDDAVDLTCGGETLDVIGRIGTDPGTRWGGPAVNTQDHTLVRLCTVTVGDRNGGDPYAPNTQWDALDVDIVTGLGNNACATP